MFFKHSFSRSDWVTQYDRENSLCQKLTFGPSKLIDYPDIELYFVYFRLLNKLHGILKEIT